MSRRRFRWDPKARKLVEIFQEAPPELGVMLMPDLPTYLSPITGKPIDGRRARREDLKRNNCRPYEGREQEVKEAARRTAYAEARLEKLAEKRTHEVWQHMPERVRRTLRGE